MADKQEAPTPQEILYKKVDAALTKLDKLDDRMDDLEKQMVAFGERCPLHNSITQQHHAALFGDPSQAKQHPGLMGRIALLEAKLRVYDLGVKALWAVSAATVTAVIVSFLK